MVDIATTLQSRRALLTAALGGVAGSVLHAVGRPQPVAATNGDTVRVGGSFTGTETTTVTNTHNASGQIGLRGINSASNGTVDGVRGEVESTGGRGVVGWAKATDGTTRGVYGRVDSPSGNGVYGYAASESGGTGVRGIADAPAGTAIWGEATSSTGPNRGVFGRSVSTSGTGVYGSAEATTGSGSGVEGRTEAAFGQGVFGLNTADHADAVGIWGRSGHGTGVLGDTLTGAGTGIHGRAGSGVGVHAESDENGTALLTNGAVRFVGAAGFAFVPHGSQKVTVASPAIRLDADTKVMAMLQSGAGAAPGVRRVAVNATAQTFTIILGGINSTGSGARVAWFLFS